MLAEELSVPSLVVVTVAVLLYCVHSCAEVVAEMCTVKLPFAARVASEQVSDWFGLDPVIEHVAGLAGGVSICQVTPFPVPAGSGSVTDTPAAVPGPELDTTMLNP